MGNTAVHRDVNAHNVLLDMKGEDISTARFTLIDFGLAVDIREWQRSKWRELGVSGDARYWPASAWLMLYNELMQPGREAAVANYVHMSDIFAYALTVVQLLVEVMDRRCNLAKIFGPAWQAYWTSATKHWERVHATFTIEDPRASRMAWIKLKEDYSRAKVHNQTQATVRELQRALHLAAYEEPVYTNLFMTLARMLDASPISWDEVIAIYSGDDHTPVPVAALYSGEALGTPVPVFENAEKKDKDEMMAACTASKGLKATDPCLRTCKAKAQVDTLVALGAANASACADTLMQILEMEVQREEEADEEEADEASFWEEEDDEDGEEADGGDDEDDEDVVDLDDDEEEEED